MENEDILIVPDVHGRDFWKKALTYTGHIVFLGDYLDPYSSEGIYPDEATANFSEIIAFAKENTERVSMLIGNHDMHYYSKRYMSKAQSSRFSYRHKEKYAELFLSNKELFELAEETKFANTKVLFSHAGVTSHWYHSHQELIGECNAENLNKLLTTDEGIDALAEISEDRGGFAENGSMVWADIAEINASDDIEGYYQIFGHTKRKELPLITKNFACLDCKQCFLLSDVMQRAKEITD